MVDVGVVGVGSGVGRGGGQGGGGGGVFDRWQVGSGGVGAGGGGVGGGGGGGGRSDLPGGWVRGQDLGGRGGRGDLRGKRGGGLQGVPRSRESSTWARPFSQLKKHVERHPSLHSCLNLHIKFSNSIAILYNIVTDCSL